MIFKACINAFILFIVSSVSAYTDAAITLTYSIENPDFTELLTKATKQSNIELDAKWVDQKILKVRLIQSAESGAKSDAIIVPSDHLGMNEFVHFSEIPDSFVPIQLTPFFASSGEVNNKRIGIPIVGGNHLVLYYNKELVDSPAPSWKEIERQQAKGDKPIIGWSFMEMFWFIPFINAFGESPVVAEQPNLNTSSMHQALEFVWNLANKGIVDPSCDYACNDERFLSQQTTYSINGMWAYNRYKQGLGDKLGVAQLPSINGRPMKPYSTSFVLAFPNKSLDSDKKAQLYKLAQLLMQPDVQNEFWQQRVGVPVRKDVYDNILDDAEQDAKVFLQTLANTQAMPNTRSMMIIWEVMLKGYTRFGAQAMSAQQTGQFMQRLAERSIATQEE